MAPFNVRGALRMPGGLLLPSDRREVIELSRAAPESDYYRPLPPTTATTDHIAPQVLTGPTPADGATSLLLTTPYYPLLTTGAHRSMYPS